MNIAKVVSQNVEVGKQVCLQAVFSKQNKMNLFYKGACLENIEELGQELKN